ISYTPQDTQLLFEVRDEGIGIPPDKLDSIFERFIQADITDARPYEGAGLGLSIAKAYVEMLGGKIWVQSTMGKGSSFFFTLPYEKDATGAEHSETDQNTEKAFGARKLRVLIVEDDQVSYWLLQRMLRGIAKDILRASNGNDAIRLAMENPDLDLILMDIKIPGMDGHETTRKIREFNPRVPIIAQTAHGFSGDREEALSNGCTDYILKPVEKNDLYAMILEYLEL
ncbi:MAG: response regulator, partial [Candidatus Cloacimonadaceae bacterium]|nr:response regulator [Candidatus Cloacimonadaceae bacterium]